MKHKGRSKLTAEEVITTFKKVHGDQYDYSRVQYIRCSGKVIIGCSDHGWFEQEVTVHKRGSGCMKCGKVSKTLKHTMNNDTVIAAFKKVHGDRYDYSKVVYVKYRSKVIIGCSVHGWFNQTPSLHKSGSGCLECSFINGGNLRRVGYNETIRLFKEVHGNKYDYSKVIYDGVNRKVTIGCPIHGWFEQVPASHKKGFGCMKCGTDITVNCNKISIDEFIVRANKKHKSKFDYSLVRLKNKDKEKVKIICPYHGIFSQRTDQHLSGSGCDKCKNDATGKRFRFTQQQFIEKAQNKHGNKYDYSKSQYTDGKSKLVITCKKHGEFIQTAKSHLAGQGCRRCKRSAGEKAISSWLKLQNISHDIEKWFEDCRSSRGKPFRFDFYLPEHNAIIEFDGEQHYKSIEYWGGKKALANTKKRDILKDVYARKKGIHLLRIPFFRRDDIPTILSEFLAQITAAA